MRRLSRLKKLLSFKRFKNVSTGKSLSEALIFGSTNSQYDCSLLIVH